MVNKKDKDTNNLQMVCNDFSKFEWFECRTGRINGFSGEIDSRYD